LPKPSLKKHQAVFSGRFSKPPERGICVADILRESSAGTPEIDLV